MLRIVADSVACRFAALTVGVLLRLSAVCLAVCAVPTALVFGANAAAVLASVVAVGLWLVAWLALRRG
jgi:hypothetical protein